MDADTDDGMQSLADQDTAEGGVSFPLAPCQLTLHGFSYRLPVAYMLQQYKSGLPANHHCLLSFSGDGQSHLGVMGTPRW